MGRKQKLEKVLHDLETSHGLYVTDCPNEYNEALADGLDANAAHDCVQESSWTLDFSESIIILKELIGEI